MGVEPQRGVTGWWKGEEVEPRDRGESRVHLCGSRSPSPAGVSEVRGLGCCEASGPSAVPLRGWGVGSRRSEMPPVRAQVLSRGAAEGRGGRGVLIDGEVASALWRLGQVLAKVPDEGHLRQRLFPGHESVSGPV